MTEPSMNYCARGGYLVDATHTLPTDPTEIDVERRFCLPVVGCTRIWCYGCNAPVRNWPGLSFSTPNHVPRAKISELYDLPDLETSPLIHRTQPEFRLYMCRCSRWLETDESALDEPDRDYFTDPDLPWRCEGHPPITLPHELDGERIENRAQLRAVVDRAFRGEFPPRTRAADRDASWHIRLHAKLLPAEASVVVASAVSALDDPDPQTRERALDFLHSVPDADALAHLFELVQRRPELFVGFSYRDQPDVTLEDKSWVVLGPLLGKPGPAQTYARSAALAGRTNSGMLDALAEHDSAWLIAHLEDIARAAPGKAEDLELSLWHLPQELKTQKNRLRIRAALGVENEPIDALRAACQDIAQRIHREIPLDGSIRPVRYALPALRSGAQLELEVGDLADVARFGAVRQRDRYLALRVNGTRIERWLAHGAIVDLESLLSGHNKQYVGEDAAPIRIVYLARGEGA